ncbi:MAG: hypothetical protein Q9186_002757 [Xanthomendoza sp. 1 TL-2023]
MVVPLRDQNGKVRYYLGAQLDITELVRGSVGLPSLQKLEARQHRNPEQTNMDGVKPHTDLMTEFQQLSETFSPRELQTLLRSQERQQMDDQVDHSFDDLKSSQAPNVRHKNSSANLDGSIGLQGFGSAPSLGFYQNYLLVRPHPSLRILFASQDLRVPGILQSPLMDQIGGSPRVRDDLYHALEHGQKVTAKVQWLTRSSNDSRPRWIHCTPLISANGLIGVWMVILVDDADNEAPTSTKQIEPEPIFVAGSTHAAEPMPVAEPMPDAKPMPAAQPMPAAESIPAAQPIPAPNKSSDIPDATPWEPVKVEHNGRNGNSRSPSIANSSSTALSESAKSASGSAKSVSGSAKSSTKSVYEKLPPVVRELPEDVPLLSFASVQKSVSTSGMNGPKTSNIFLEREESYRSNGFSSRSRQPPDTQKALPLRPGPRIAGKAYSFTSEHGISADEGRESLSSRGGERPMSRDSHISVAQSSIRPPDIKWRRPNDQQEAAVPPVRGSRPSINAQARPSLDAGPSPPAWKTKKSLNPYGFLFND